MDDEISLHDVLSFFCENWRTIAGLGIAGTFATAIYTVNLPSLYAAKAQIEMAQVGNVSAGVDGAMLVVSVEVPDMLIERLEQPTTYSSELVKACDLQNAQLPGEEMTRVVSARAPKRLPTVVIVSVQRQSPEVATRCANAVFEMIRMQQTLLVKPYVDSIKSRRDGLQMRLADAMAVQGKLVQSGDFGGTYILWRDEKSRLLDEIAETEHMLSLNSDARLLAPVYASPTPVGPNWRKWVTVGAIAGVSLGIVLALAFKLFGRQYDRRTEGV